MPIADANEWLMAALSRQLTRSVSSMTASDLKILWRRESDAKVPEAVLGAVKHLSLGPGASIWIGAAEATWRFLGAASLQAAGVDNPSDSDVRDTFLEILSQAAGAVANDLAGLVGSEVTVDGTAGDPPATGAPAQCFEFEAADGAALHVILAVPSAHLVENLSARIRQDGQSTAQPVGAPEASSVPDEPSKFDLLLDVELPVSVSFGRSQVALKDVLKLATGSIVELNRSVTEPVEIIVNNCVIARGEVVVVSGNYGVRVRQIISRSERLRTLH